MQAPEGRAGGGEGLEEGVAEGVRGEGVRGELEGGEVWEEGDREGCNHEGEVMEGKGECTEGGIHAEVSASESSVGAGGGEGE